MRTFDAHVRGCLANPAAPRVVQKFSGVVKWLQDERNFIYVLNGDGLWVVSEPAVRPPEQTESSNQLWRVIARGERPISGGGGRGAERAMVPVAPPRKS
jgi:hypothetical protein